MGEGEGILEGPVNEQSSLVIIGDQPDNSHRSGSCLQFPRAYKITAIINEEPLSISQLMQVPRWRPASPARRCVAPNNAASMLRIDINHAERYPHC